MHIIGTAGHVDHGKSALVQALTGVNPDRWAEERERGMTLDLGFARLAFEDVDAGIIDVPGHERFLHNMLAGAAGMELLLLVIAATEGVMPQTREHLAILQFLNVQRAIVVVTKRDLLDDAGLEHAVAGIRAQLNGTMAEAAPVVAVSTITGEGLEELRERIRAELSLLRKRDDDAPVYLPIDRAFTLAGRGTIVTGTLMQGRIAAGETLALEPSGDRVRVRSIQVFGEARESVTGGTRVALNLPGVDRERVSRGAVIADPQFATQTQFAVRFTPLGDSLALLRRRTPVRAHIGSAEIAGTLRLREVPTTAEPIDAVLDLRAPVLAFPGVRFVLRRMSPKTLLGGGEIASASAEAESGDERNANERSIAAVLSASGLEPLELGVIAFRTNLREDVAQASIDALVARGEVMRVARPDAVVDAAAADALADRIASELQVLHEREPWAMGTTSLQLARTLGVAEPLLVRLILAYAADGRLVQRAGYIALPSHEPHLSAAQRTFFDELVPLNPETPTLPASFATVSSAVKASDIPGARKAFDMLLARGALMRVDDALYRGSQIANIHGAVEEFIDKNGRMTMAEFRDLIGTSRKYAVPLLEWFDSRGITVRSGDYRMLRSRRGERTSSV